MSQALPLMNQDEIQKSPGGAEGFGGLSTARGHLPLKAMSIETSISGLVAATELEQVFVNVLDEPVEATYVFPLPDRAAVKRLVSEDNADRAQLYAEMAKANNHPEWEADIRKSFARRWVAKAKAGWYYQDDSGAWKQK